jgi:methyl-accepting chemotaxis protein
MVWWQSNPAGQNASAMSAAIDRSQAVIEFNLDGAILAANENFLAIVGYALPEIMGKHHSMFVDASEHAGADYREFWKKLAQGEPAVVESKRIGKSGKALWIRESYGPVLGKDGKPSGIVGLATDITSQKHREMDDAGKIAGIHRSQAVVEFNLDGTVVTANENFLKGLGYSLAEIQGKHHSMFVAPSVRDSAGYREFLEKLSRGEPQPPECKRIGKGGNEIWFQASYHPVLDETGKLVKVVKFARDVTKAKLRNADFLGQVAAIQKAQVVIECDMQGIILTANDNFLKALGYSMPEIKGKHHSMLIDPAERDGAAYRELWAELNAGRHQAGEYKSIGKGGREVWVQASYNPILDMNDKPFKVVEYAIVTTAQVIARKKSERVSDMMGSVASGAEQLNASVHEISEAMSKSREMASGAVSRVDVADEQARRLSEAAEAMSGIVELIGSITGQINLLALNATIESARAGEAGRGFAVVASEVKSLANQAKAATDKITHEIGNLNSISGDVVGALLAIKNSIQAVSECAIATAAAVEEQSRVTAEMSSSMQRAAAEAANIGS